jgi:hypothetical protein
MITMTRVLVMLACCFTVGLAHGAPEAQPELLIEKFGVTMELPGGRVIDTDYAGKPLSADFVRIAAPDADIGLMQKTEFYESAKDAIGLLKISHEGATFSVTKLPGRGWIVAFSGPKGLWGMKTMKKLGRRWYSFYIRVKSEAAQQAVIQAATSLRIAKRPS